MSDGKKRQEKPCFHTRLTPYSNIFYMYCFGQMVTYVEDIKCSANTAQRLFLLAAVEVWLIWSHCRCSMFWSQVSLSFQPFDVTRNSFGWHEVVFSKYLNFVLCKTQEKTSGLTQYNRSPQWIKWEFYDGCHCQCKAKIFNMPSQSSICKRDQESILCLKCQQLGYFDALVIEKYDLKE